MNWYICKLLCQRNEIYWECEKLQCWIIVPLQQMTSGDMMARHEVNWYVGTPWSCYGMVQITMNDNGYCRLLKYPEEFTVEMYRKKVKYTKHYNDTVEDIAEWDESVQECMLTNYAMTVHMATKGLTKLAEFKASEYANGDIWTKTEEHKILQTICERQRHSFYAISPEVCWKIPAIEMAHCIWALGCHVLKDVMYAQSNWGYSETRVARSVNAAFESLQINKVIVKHYHKINKTGKRAKMTFNLVGDEKILIFAQAHKLIYQIHKESHQKFGKNFDILYVKQAIIDASDFSFNDSDNEDDPTGMKRL